MANDGNSLKLWLKQNKLEHLNLLENSALGEYTLEDLKLLENESEVDDFVKELNVKKIIHAKKLKKAVLQLINDDNIQATSEQKQIENMMYYGLNDSDDDCSDEAFIDPSNDRRQAIWESPNHKDDIIKCIGSLRVEFADKQKITAAPEFCLGTGTVFHIDQNNCCQILTAAHNVYQFVRECPNCKKTTITRKCQQCGVRCVRVKPLELIKATSVKFSHRCIFRKQIDPNGVEKLFGDPVAVYDIKDCIIRKSLYKEYSGGIAGYDLCVMTFKCNKSEDVEMYKGICNNIHLVSDPKFGQSFNAVLYIFGYPGDKGYVPEFSEKKQHQMYGMSTGMDGNKFKLEEHVKTKRKYIVNQEIDTQPGTSGSIIWSYADDDATVFLVYGVHSGGNQEKHTNYGAFLDQDSIQWIQRTQFKLLLKPGFNIVPSVKREYMIDETKQEDSDKNLVIKTTIRDFDNDEKKQTEPKRLFADDKHKIILICGKTGTGKTTLINSMMNYLYGIEQDDNFRLKLIEEDEKSGGDADSHTDHITSYTIKKPKGGYIDYDLTIIDTPGFGDSRGIQKDEQTLEEFKYVFDKILTNINGICFLVKTTDNRLDNSQTYIFNSMLNLWAKNVLDNIFILMTFADGGKARCIDALDKNEVLKQCLQRFKINNSAFTDEPHESDECDEICKLFWSMGMKCFKDFFDKLDRVQAATIEESKQVVIQRDLIKNQIRHLVDQIEIAVSKQIQIAERQKMVKQQRKKIDDEEEVVWEEEITYWEPELIQHYSKHAQNRAALSCPVHKRTCHLCYKTSSCYLLEDKCIEINDESICKVCGCDYKVHVKNYEYVLKSKKVTKSIFDLNENDTKMKEFVEAKNKLSKSEQMLQTLQAEADQNVKDIERKLALAQNARTELTKIAMREQLTTIGNYIDELIEIERASPTLDSAKIKMLIKLKKQEDAIAKLQKTAKPSAKDFGF